MISTLLSAFPWIIPALAGLGLVVVVPVGLWLAPRPRAARILLAVSVLAVLILTLTPEAASGDPRACTWAGSLPLDVPNVALFVPSALLIGIVTRRPWVAAVGGSLGSAFIELVQLLVPAIGRRCDGADWVANSVGALGGALLAWAVLALWRARRQRAGLGRAADDVRRPSAAMGRIRTAAAAAVVLGVYVVGSLIAPLPPATVGQIEVERPDVTRPTLDFGGVAAAIVVDDTGVLDTVDADVERPIGRISRLVVALAAVSAGPLTAEQQDELILPYLQGLPESTSELISAAFGSDAGFAESLATWLEDRGLSDTRIVDPGGESGQNMSSASDMLAVVTEAHDVEDWRGLIPEGPLDHEAIVTHSVARDGVDIRVLGVLLAGVDGAALDSIVAQIEAGYSPATLVESGQQVGVATTEWGTSTRLLADDTLVATTWGGAPLEPSGVPLSIESTTSGGGTAEISFSAGGGDVAVGISPEAPLADPGVLWRLTHPWALLF